MKTRNYLIVGLSLICVVAIMSKYYFSRSNQFDSSPLPVGVENSLNGYAPVPTANSANDLESLKSLSMQRYTNTPPKERQQLIDARQKWLEDNHLDLKSHEAKRRGHDAA